LEQPTTLKHTVPSYTYPTGGTWLITLASGGGGGGGGVGVGDGGGDRQWVLGTSLQRCQFRKKMKMGLNRS